MVAAVGVLSLFHTSFARRMIESWINIHLLFGMLLCGLVLARYRWQLRELRRVPPGYVRELTSHLACIVYLMLYVVVGLRLGIGIVGSLLHDGSSHYDLLGDPFHNGTDTGEFRMLLATGICVLVVERLLALRLWAAVTPRSTDDDAPERAQDNDDQRWCTPGRQQDESN